MNDFDLLLLTSSWEGVPITILEAIELNIPILATDVGGIREVIGEKSVFDKNTKNINSLIEDKLNSKNDKIDYSQKNFEKYLSLYEGK